MLPVQHVLRVLHHEGLMRRWPFHGGPCARHDRSLSEVLEGYRRGEMYAMLAWIGKLLATLAGGPGIVVLGDPGLTADPQRPSPPVMVMLVLGGFVLVFLLAGPPGVVLLAAALVLAGLRSFLSRQGGRRATVTEAERSRPR